MRPSVLIGNDVVDLSLPETQDKAHILRFIKRVCTLKEQSLLDEAQAPHRMLWALWSAKETAYKIAKKRRPEIIFSPIRFVVEPVSLFPCNGEAVVMGNVRHRETEIQICWHCTGEYIHCVGIGADKPLEEVLTAVVREGNRSLHKEIEEKPLSSREALSVLSPASQRVRQLAKQLLAVRGLSGVEIVRERNRDRFGPPRVWHRGRPLAGCDLSLSHHGRFVAAAIWVHATKEM